MKTAKILILIVEDEAPAAEMYAVKFRQLGYDVDIAHDGQEGFDKMVAERPALVLMDILMPGLAGDVAVEKAKHEPATKDIPIIMLTNFSDSIELRNAMNQGAIDYIVKPETTPSQVAEKVQRVLDQSRKP
jgi:CheY-like chemotaxis protein